MAVSIQSFQEEHRTVWQHYKLIQLGSDSSGLAQANAVYDMFVEEGFDDFIKVKTMGKYKKNGFSGFFLITINTNCDCL